MCNAVSHYVSWQTPNLWVNGDEWRSKWFLCLSVWHTYEKNYSTLCISTCWTWGWITRGQTLASYTQHLISIYYEKQQQFHVHMWICTRHLRCTLLFFARIISPPSFVWRLRLISLRLFLLFSDNCVLDLPENSVSQLQVYYTGGLLVPSENPNILQWFSFGLGFLC